MLTPAKFFDMSGNNKHGENEVVETEAESGRLLGAVDTAINAITAQMGTDKGAKGSITDLIRLLQLRKDLEDERPRRVTARWIEDECDTSID